MVADARDTIEKLKTELAEEQFMKKWGEKHGPTFLFHVFVAGGACSLVLGAFGLGVGLIFMGIIKALGLMVLLATIGFAAGFMRCAIDMKRSYKRDKKVWEAEIEA